MQQDTKLHSLFIYGKLRYLFRVASKPIIRGNTTVSTASGSCQTVTATCRYGGRDGGVGIAGPNPPRLRQTAVTV